MTSVSVSERKTWPFRLQLGPQLEVVLDDPVVDHARRGLRRGAGGRSPRDGRPWVAQRVCPMPMPRGGDRLPLEAVLEVGELARRAAHVRSSPPSRTRDAGRVVAAVLEPPQPLDQDRRGVRGCRRSRRCRTWSAPRGSRGRPRGRGRNMPSRGPEVPAAAGRVVRRGRPSCRPGRRMARGRAGTEAGAYRGRLRRPARPPPSARPSSPAASGPALDVPLGHAGERQRTGGHVLGDRRPGADVGAGADRDRRDELRVASR